jgi:hypothetical protein
MTPTQVHNQRHMTPSMLCLIARHWERFHHRARVPSCRASSSGEGPPSGSPRHHAAFKFQRKDTGEQRKRVSKSRQRRLSRARLGGAPFALLCTEPTPPDARRRAVALHLWGWRACARRRRRWCESRGEKGEIRRQCPGSEVDRTRLWQSAEAPDFRGRRFAPLPVLARRLACFVKRRRGEKWGSLSLARSRYVQPNAPSCVPSKSLP